MNVLSNIDLVLDYLDNMADVVDGDYGHPEPNEEMTLLGELQEARDAVADMIRRVHNLGLLYEAGCDIDSALAELEQLAEDMGGSK